MNLTNEGERERIKMRILIAPDSFKESMTAMEAAHAIEKGWRSVTGERDTFKKIPMADGGEGTTQSLHDALGGKFVTTTVTGPLGSPVEATYSIANEGRTAVIEMAAASGLDLVPKAQRNPLISTTYGTGELLRHALDQGVSHIILGIGGSATNDGGAGLLQALGVRLYDAQGNDLPFGGEALQHLARIDREGQDPRFDNILFEVACDVDNPLLGYRGATAIYSQQKGATAEDQVILESALTQWNTVIEKTLNKRVKNIPGAGAAGGLGAGLCAFLNVTLRRGIDIVLDETQFYHYALNTDLVITGEGAIDGQTIYGKTPIGVAKAAKKYHKPVIAVAGVLGEGYEAVEMHGIDAVFSLSTGPRSVESALKRGPDDLTEWARNMAKFSMIHHQ